MAHAKQSNVPHSVHDYLVLPLRVPAQPSFIKRTNHYLYLRANAPKIPTENTPRELFLVNVPVDATETHIRSLFADQLGGLRIEKVDFEGARVGKGVHAPVAPVKPGKKRKRGDDGDEETPAEEIGSLPKTWERELHRSGGTAIVTLVDRPSAELALKEAKRAIRNKATVSWSAGIQQSKVPPLGAARYLSHHRLRYPDHAVLQESVDAFMEAFTAREELRAKNSARLRSEPDEDGFITVTRGGRSGPAREAEVKAKEEELKKREKNRVKGDFYRFQVREKNKERAKDLVRHFEEDQRRLAEMKRRKGKIRPE